ncbi:rhodanese-like domain-containing protein [Ginsengibacter hankyongi]|uniref:Rhodanese-like domain-containing protein n=1 Tax=Ginsengibacter hankyongi TaxID=2607284 RepID=A0A5J5IMP9_9BACT|nr:rhodanese-like domain-containing protein [Ginsengibacter hankyongi]KAA9041828.1 rhodanese-like domain-containing protein [Ginsengibacter hankyongi]
MKKYHIFSVCFLVFILAACKNSSGQNPENWTSDQLTEPSALAAILKENKDVPVMFSVGPGAIIPNSIDIGMVKDEKNLAKFQQQISKLPKSTNILIYCGCCPFEHCPDVRPAIALLQKMKFTNYHLLNLPNNIKTDWIAKGYPTLDK